jgi:hypothetical protein
MKIKNIKLILILCIVCSLEYTISNYCIVKVIEKLETSFNIGSIIVDISTEEKSIEENKIICSITSEEQGWKIYNTNNKISLEVMTKYSLTNSNMYYLLGFLEGYEYYKDLENHYMNIYITIYNSKQLNEKTSNYIKQQLDYAVEVVNLTKLTDPVYSEALETSLSQMNGVYDGYLSRKKTHPKNNNSNNDKESTLFLNPNVDNNNYNEEIVLTKENVYVLTMLGDLEDLDIAFKTNKSKKIQSSYDEDYTKKQCTVIGRLVYENDKVTDLIVSHNTHNIYSLMNRVYKNYDLNLKFSNSSKWINGYKFTSRPGDLNSKDDFYITTSNLIITETSLEILNK